MTDAELPELPAGFDPEADWQEVHPEQMNDAERRIAAMQAFYEIQRAAIALEGNSEYLARVAGLSNEEMDALARHAEQDEYGEGTTPPESEAEDSSSG